MSEEFEVPPELAVFESQLRSVPVKVSKLNRDQLLYEAGWAAACGQEKRLPTIQWMWPAATGAFATLATVLALMLIQQKDLPNRVDTLANGPTIERSENGEPAAEASGNLEIAPALVVAQSAPATGQIDFRSNIRDVRWQGQLRSSLAARGQFENFDWDTEPAVDPTGPEIENGSKAIRDLLEEFLPESNSRTYQQPPQPIWNWIKQTWGDVI